MKTEAVTKSIIDNYRILYEKTNVIKPHKEHFMTTWGLNFVPKGKNEGFVNEIGSINRKKSKVEIRNGELIRVKKPFFSTWNRTLNNINKMLKNMISEYENNEIVVKKYLNAIAFSKEFVERLSKIKR